MSEFDMKENMANDQFYYGLSRVPEGTHRVIRQCWFNMLKGLERTVKDDINNTPKRGVTRIIRLKSGRRKRHTASAPGQAHANITRDTRKSIGWIVSGTSDAKFGYGVLDADAPEYSKWLEFGVPLGNKATARPSIFRNLVNLDFESHFSSAAKKGIKP